MPKSTTTKRVGVLTHTRTTYTDPTQEEFEEMGRALTEGPREWLDRYEATARAALGNQDERGDYERGSERWFAVEVLRRIKSLRPRLDDDATMRAVYTAMQLQEHMSLAYWTLNWTPEIIAGQKQIRWWKSGGEAARHSSENIKARRQHEIWRDLNRHLIAKHPESSRERRAKEIAKETKTNPDLNQRSWHTIVKKLP